MTYQPPQQPGYRPPQQPYGPDSYRQQDGYQPQPPRGYQAPPPGYYQPPQYQPPPRRRHTARNVLLSVGGVIVLIVVIAVAANGGGGSGTGASVVTTTPGPSTAASTPAKAKTASVAHIGSVIDLTGNDRGEKMAVKLVRFLRRVRGTDFTSAGAGHRLVAAQFRLTDIGSAAYSDAPDNSAVAVDSAGQSYQSNLGSVADCQAFGGTENIAPGNSGLGCIVFTVPRHARITMIQFTLDSGFASDTGQWRTG
jgi:hypothetical protein